MIDFSLPYSKPDFNAFLEGFLPEDYSKQEEEINIPFQSKYFEQATYLGESKKLNLSVYEVRHTSEHDARVGLTREMFRLMAHFGKRRSLVVLVPQNGNTYRFSLVTIDLKLDENDNPIREYSNPKRYSFILGEDAKLHTPQRFLISQGRVTDFDDLLQRFSVEVVNKEFYNQIAVMFSRLVGGKRKQGSHTQDFEHVLELPSTPYDGQEQKYKEFAVRLIGRTVFCWFLKKKKSANNIPLIPEDVLSTFAISFNPNYYHSRVEPLFFNVLNTPVNERTGEFKEKPYDKIPFLNGGLFEPQPDDFYTGNYPNYALKIPDEWWKDFIEILETYNFTIDENTSIDIDLSVDPEMLGRIFENLLAEINPETGESARKSTGSYYTPRPIVEYMVDESLKQYLVTKTGIAEERLETLLDYSREESGLEPDEELKVIEALNKIKVLDPACGSGAFPMGILQKMLLILQKVDHEAQNSIQQILNDIQDPVYRKLLESKLKAAQVYDDDDLDDYARKLNIIRRSIYGVDIQPVAVDIAKLRFFLSIIVDEVIQDELPNRGIEPLPNLEFKFVCANTLIPLPPNRELFENADFIEKLEQLREQYFISFGEEKEKIKKEFRSVQAQMFNTSIDLLNREPGTHNDRPQTQTQMLATWNPFSNETTKWFDPKWMFGETEGFDVILGNPPYISNWSLSELDRNMVVKLSKLYKEILTGHWDIFICFIYLAYKILSNQGVLTYILPTSFFKEKHSKLIREFLIKETTIIELLDFDEQVIFNEVARQTGIFILRKKKNPENNIKIRNGLNLPNKIAKQDFFLNLKNSVFKLKVNQKDITIFKKMNTDSVLLGTLVCVNTGVVAHSKKGSPISFKKDDVIFKEQKDGFKKYIIGSNLKKYLIKFDNDFLDYSSKRDYYHRPKYPLLFESEKIVIRRISGKGNTFIACYDNEAFYSNDNLMHLVLWNENILQYQSPEKKWNISLSKEYNLKYILAIINSKLNTYFFSKFLSTDTLQGSYSSIYPEDIRQIPIKKINSDKQILIINLVEKIIQQKKVGDDAKELSNQIDLMVYKLYELTYDEALIVDPELPGIISREDYEKAGIEELAEWEV